ncbi:MAG: response regulator transcription factor [Bacteroidales bacterium]|nr:response regulator transcription factor [Bacteroidales bacterium]
MINCIIIEDEPLAVEKLKNYITKIPYLNLIESFNSALPAISFLKNNQADLIFLDIEMKVLTGIQLLETVKLESKIIITTAYEKYALKGFELQVSDYLLKPISFERFVKACDKVISELSEKKSHVHCKIFIKTEYRLEGINTSEILFIEGMGDYRMVVTIQQKIMTLQTFKELIEILPNDKFCRVHNSFIVSLDKIEKIERNRIKISDKLIPISDSYGKIFYKTIKIQT